MRAHGAGGEEDLPVSLRCPSLRSHGAPGKPAAPPHPHPGCNWNREDCSHRACWEVECVLMGTADREGQRDVALQELGTPTEGASLT